MSYRELWIAGALALGSCGGLAADGPSGDVGDCVEGPCASGPAPHGEGPVFLDQQNTGSAATNPGALDRDDSRFRSEDTARVPGAPGAPRVGDSCGPGTEPGISVRIGEIILDASGNCGAGHLCLMWASGVDDACALTASGAGCEVVDRDDELVPVPPLLAPALPEVDRVCTCRCDGSPDGNDCLCPEGMACRALITSSGVNGAAADYVGSYCLY